MIARVIAPLPADFTVEDHGSLYLLRPVTTRAIEWVDDHLPSEAIRWTGAVVIEHRFIGDIVLGIQQDGLEVVV